MSTIVPEQIAFDQFVVTPQEPTKRWTVAEYHELIRLGVLKSDDPYELIEGWLVTKMTHGAPHDYAILVLVEDIIRTLPAGWCCRGQSAITLADGEPEPDVAVCVGPRSRYGIVHPTASEIAVVIEVSDTTLTRDRGIKLRTYARAGIPEYWIVNVIDRIVEVYTEPTANGLEPARYIHQQDYPSGSIVPLKIAGQQCASFAVDELIR